MRDFREMFSVEMDDPHADFWWYRSMLGREPQHATNVPIATNPDRSEAPDRDEIEDWKRRLHNNDS